MKCILLPDGSLIVQTDHLTDFLINLKFKPVSELTSDEKISTMFSDWLTPQEWEEESLKHQVRDTNYEEDRIVELFRVDFIESLNFSAECAKIDDEFNVAFSSVGRS